jgi:putative acetyltransferase
VLIRRETPADADAVHAVTAAAFAPSGSPDVPEARLLTELRACDAWLPALSLVALAGDVVVGHVVCSRGRVEAAPVLALGPLSVLPARQRRGVGLALVHTVLGAADALGEPLVALLGEPLVALLGAPGYYARFGFRLAEEYGIVPQVPEWRPHFQVRTLSAYVPEIRGTFAYPEPFDRV